MLHGQVGESLNKLGLFGLLGFRLFSGLHNLILQYSVVFTKHNVLLWGPPRLGGLEGDCSSLLW